MRRRRFGVISAMRAALIAIAALALAWFAWRDARLAIELGRALAGEQFVSASAPELAQRRINLLTIYSGTLSAADARAIEDLAIKRLEDDALDAVALRTLALVDSERDESHDLLGLAHRLSRRDALTEVALLNRAVMLGDPAKAFAHFDHALSVTPAMGEALLEPYSAAVADRRARRVIARYADRPWFGEFLAKALGNRDTTADAARMVLDANIDLSGPDDARLSAVLSQLAAAQRHDLARQVAVRLGRIDEAVFGTFSLARATLDPRITPYSWRITELGGTTWSVDRGLSIMLDPDRSTIVLERLTMLGPGRYRLTQTIGEAGSGPVPLLTWQMACVTSAGQTSAWRQPVPVSEQLVTYASVVTIAPDCRTQNWQLRAIASDRQTRASLRLARIELVRL
jgi:hypothetical protein